MGIFSKAFAGISDGLVHIFGLKTKILNPNQSNERYLQHCAKKRSKIVKFKPHSQHNVGQKECTTAVAAQLKKQPYYKANAKKHCAEQTIELNPMPDFNDGTFANMLAEHNKRFYEELLAEEKERKIKEIEKKNAGIFGAFYSAIAKFKKVNADVIENVPEIVSSSTKPKSKASAATCNKVARVAGKRRLKDDDAFKNIGAQSPAKKRRVTPKLRKQMVHRCKVRNKKNVRNLKRNRKGKVCRRVKQRVPRRRRAKPKPAQEIVKDSAGTASQATVDQISEFPAFNIPYVDGFFRGISNFFANPVDSEEVIANVVSIPSVNINELDETTHFVYTLVNALPAQSNVVVFGETDVNLFRGLQQDVEVVSNSVENNVFMNLTNTQYGNESLDMIFYNQTMYGEDCGSLALEANRIVKRGGFLAIGEVYCCFDDHANFVKGMKRCGFKLLKKEIFNNLLYKYVFEKERCVPRAAKVKPFCLIAAKYRKTNE